MRTTKVKLSTLVFDYDLYPRQETDPANVTRLLEVVRAGIKLPPIIIDKKTKRIVDGFHRTKAYLRISEDDALVEVEAREYKTDAALYLDAVRLNAAHGQKLTPYDHRRILERARQLKIDTEELAAALSLTLTKIEHIRDTRTARISNKLVALKNTARNLNGLKLTKKQEIANSKASGMSQLFIVNQVINLIEGEILDKNNERLLTRLTDLYALLSGILKAA